MAKLMTREDTGDELFDSGYTDKEIERIFRSLAKGAVFTWGQEPLMHAMAIGLSNGDVVEHSGRDTVLLPRRREEIDQRVARVRAAIAGGATLQQAVDSLEER